MLQTNMEDSIVMTFEQIKEHYDVNQHGIIASLGKFEGEYPVVVALWDLAMDSGEDELIYDGDCPVSVFVVDDEMRTQFPETQGIYAIAVYESDQGFVNSVWYANESELNMLISR